MTGRKKPATTTLGSADLLLELGTEELPAAYLPDLISQFKQEAETLFARSTFPSRRWRAMALRAGSC